MRDKTDVDLLVTNANIFTGDRRRSHFFPGAIAVAAGQIMDVGVEAEVLASYNAGRKIDAKGGIVHPGFIDTHLHLTSTALHGLPMNFSGKGDTDLPTYASIKFATDDEITAAFTQAAAVALLRRGFTLFMEAGTVFETDAFAESLTACGMRGLVSAPFTWDDVSQFEEHEPGFVSGGLMSRAPAEIGRIVDQLNKEIRRNNEPEALVKGYVCIYGECTGSDELISEALAIARDNGVLYNQHQGFLRLWYDVEVERYNESGISRLNRLGALAPETLLSHMNVLSDEDAIMIEAARPGLVWCPSMSMTFRSFPAEQCYFPRFCRSGVSVSLGTDVTLFHPLGTAGLTSSLIAASIGEPLAYSDPFYMQTIDAANNLMLGDQLGSISVGKHADIVIRAMGDITQTSLDDHGTVLALGSTMIPVDTVLIGGQIVMKEGRMAALDQDEILTSALAQRQRLFERALGS